MSAEKRKTNYISKETRDAIKRFLTTNVSHSEISPSTPQMELDSNFSRLLQKKREEQLEASRQRLFESNASRMTESTIEPNTTNKSLKEHEHKGSKARKTPEILDLENSMLCGGNKPLNESSCTDDSFLALERQCNLEDKKERIMNANDTILFDVEPPAELWNQTVNQTSMMPIFKVSQEINDEGNEENIENETSDREAAESSKETIEISPVKYIRMIRPSTIIEETSSQMESSNKNNSSSMTSKTSLDNSTTESFKSFENSADDSGSKLFNRSNLIKSKRQSRRETFAFKRRNYTFFPEENLDRIDESASFSEDNENEDDFDLLKFKSDSPKNEKKSEQDQFNDTLEAMDYFLEKGRQLNEQTPAAKRNNLQRSVIETPLFSCKRKRLLDEISMMEVMPLPKRGPLIDFTTPEKSNQARTT